MLSRNEIIKLGKEHIRNQWFDGETELKLDVPVVSSKAVTSDQEEKEVLSKSACQSPKLPRHNRLPLLSLIQVQNKLQEFQLVENKKKVRRKKKNENKFSKIK